MKMWKQCWVIQQIYIKVMKIKVLNAEKESCEWYTTVCYIIRLDKGSISLSYCLYQKTKMMYLV